MAGTDDRTIDALGLLSEPARRRLYEYVAASRTEVGRDEAAEATGLSRSLAAFHLDKLVAAGLLAVSYRRLSGRTGPGAGRPAKLYRRAEGERAVSLPPRAYGPAGRILAEVVEEAGLDRELQAAARRAGLAMTAAPGGEPGESADTGAADGGIEGMLAARGYEPWRDGPAIRLRNCPFHTLAREFPPLVCGMNLALLEGMLAGSGAGRGWTARIDPRPGECCVVIEPKTKAG